MTDKTSALTNGFPPEADIHSDLKTYDLNGHLKNRIVFEFQWEQLKITTVPMKN